MFTAHPTFLLARAQAEAVARAASADTKDDEALVGISPQRDTITLETEHAAAMAAITRAQGARDSINAGLLATAAARWPGRWRW